jgi:hypothetical protein
MRRFEVLAILSVAALYACATTPKQTVELSATVGRDIEAVHVAHIALVKRYFARMDADVNGFVNETYRPYAIDRTMKAFHLVEKIVHPPEPLDAVDEMGLFVDTITRDIEGYRQELLQPIHAQRDKVLTSLEDAYRQIQDGNSIVTGHLASLVAVQDAQDAALSKAGLQGLREKLVDSTALASERLSQLTQKAEFARGKEDEIVKKIEEVKKAAAAFGK